MANIYVRSGAGGAGTGADWANAFTTLAAAMTAGANGDDFWVAGDHAETQASAMTITCKGIPATPCRVFCVSHTGSVPPVAADLLTTATISTTGANAINIASGTVYFYGITFQGGDGASAGTITVMGTTQGAYTFEACQLYLRGTSGAARVSISSNGANYGRAIFINTPIRFSSTSQSMYARQCDFIWKNTTFGAVGSIPTSFITDYGGGGTPYRMHMYGCDLSALSGNLVNGIVPSAKLVFDGCRLHASATVATGLLSQAGGRVELVSCGSAANAYRQESYQYAGTETTETTIVRTGGASLDGTPVARKYVTTANAKFLQPFEASPLVAHNPTTGANVTVTVYGIWTGGAVPNNDDVWMEVEYFGNASYPLATLVSTAKATPLTANAAVASDGSSWGGGTTAFKLETTLSSPQPQIAGPITVRVFVGAASATVYIDPVAVLS